MKETAMTKKDYVAIASAISHARSLQRTVAGLEALDCVAGFIVQVMQRDNQHFDNEDFLKACKEF